MTTTSPSWFESWSSSWPDLQAIYELVIPRQYPSGLYDAAGDSDEQQDRLAEARVLSWIPQAMTWIKKHIFPQLDTTYGLFLDLWEASTGVQRSATLQSRADRIVAWMRHRGTITLQAIRDILEPIWPSTGAGADISVIVPTIADIVASGAGAGDYAWRKIFEVMFFDTNTIGWPVNWREIDFELNRRKPAYETWTASWGDDGYFYWDDDNACWDRGVWS